MHELLYPRAIGLEIFARDVGFLRKLLCFELCFSTEEHKLSTPLPCEICKYLLKIGVTAMLGSTEGLSGRCRSKDPVLIFPLSSIIDPKTTCCTRVFDIIGE
ncbi:hypothetical protein ISCGN_004072 [Ixodes scapularis]